VSQARHRCSRFNERLCSGVYSWAGAETSVIVFPTSIQYADDAPDVLHTGRLHVDVLPATGRSAFAAQRQTS
jgi:hypothetical protein